MKIEGSTPVKLEVTLENVTHILNALGTQPYDKVAGVIASIQSQTAQQIRALTETEPSNPDGEQKP
jgi:hypothetical protein